MTVSNNPDIVANPSRLQAFWQWWSGELRAMTPPALTSWVVGDVAVTDVSVDPAGIALLRAEGVKFVDASRIANADLATSPVLRELRAKGQNHVRLLLKPDQVLVKTMTLPAAIEENLREAVGFELDRHTPFKATQVYYDVRRLKRDSQHETIDVGLVVVARTVIDPLVSILRKNDLAVAAIGVTNCVPLAGQMPELLPVGEKPTRKWGNLLRLNLALLAAVVVLALIALLLPIWQKREHVIALWPLIEKTGTEYADTVRIQDEYTRLATGYNYIAGKKHAMQPSLVVLEELSRISPDTTWAQSLDLKSSGKIRELTIIGEAQSATKVIETLEQSLLFQNATQRAPTQRGSQPNTERYQVATEVKARQIPAAIAINEMRDAPIVTPPISPNAAPASVVLPANAKADVEGPAMAEPAGASAPAPLNVSPPVVAPKQLPATVLPATPQPIPAKKQP